jgi:serine/threonine protein phosphatase PrpC
MTATPATDLPVIAAAAATHIGRRTQNEDSHLCLPDLGLFAVADGMGGYEGGEVASRLAVETLAAFFHRQLEDPDSTWPYALDRTRSLAENQLTMAIHLGHAGIAGRRQGRLQRMGSTVVALLLDGPRAVVGHLGDSRAYRLRQGRLDTLTRDHSLYAELQAGGTPLPERAQCDFAHVITRALGMPGRADPELRVLDLLAGDTFLLCSDGLFEPVGEPGMAELLALPPAQASARLVETAYQNGGRDNITAVVIHLGHPAVPPVPPGPPAPPDHRP